MKTFRTFPLEGICQLLTWRGVRWQLATYNVNLHHLLNVCCYIPPCTPTNPNTSHCLLTYVWHRQLSFNMHVFHSEINRSGKQYQLWCYRWTVKCALHSKTLSSWKSQNNYTAVTCNQISWFLLIHCTLTVVSRHLLPTPTAVSTQSKRAHWCNSHFIHCTKIEVGDGVWGCTRGWHWVSGVRGGSPSPVLHRVTSDHLTRSQCWSAPSDSELACIIQCHH